MAKRIHLRDQRWDEDESGAPPECGASPVPPSRIVNDANLVTCEQCLRRSVVKNKREPRFYVDKKGFLRYGR